MTREERIRTGRMTIADEEWLRKGQSLKESLEEMRGKAKLLPVREDDLDKLLEAPSSNRVKVFNAIKIILELDDSDEITEGVIQKYAPKLERIYSKEEIDEDILDDLYINMFSEHHGRILKLIKRELKL